MRDRDPAISQAVFNQAKADCAKSLSAKPIQGYVNQSKYLHTLGGESIVNLTKDGFSAYVLCFRSLHNKVVIDQSQISVSAIRRQKELNRHWEDGMSWSGAGTTMFVLAAILSLILGNRH